MTIPQSVTFSPVIKRSVVLNGHKTSVSLEEPFWQRLKHLAADHEMSPQQFIAFLEARIEGRRRANLSATLRQFVLADLEHKCRLLNAKAYVAAHDAGEQSARVPS